MRFRSVGLLVLIAAAAAAGLPLAGCFSDPTAPAAAGGATSGTTVSGVDAGARGCVPPGGALPPMVAGGYYTQGATVCTADGQPYLFHGLDRPSMEWRSDGENITPGDFELMASWNANVVRIALNQDFWLSGAVLYDPAYESNVRDAVHDAETAGLDVILDLHWSDRGDLDASPAGGPTKQDTTGGSNQQQMADVNSIEFWKEVATDFGTDRRVLFELYNEPNGIPWSVWRNGGESAGFMVVGMQQLYQTVRDTGAKNLVIAGGLDYAYDLSQARNYLIDGYNVMYATHPYDKSDNQPGNWESSFGYLSTDNIAPVIATEFGDPRTACTGAWDTELVAFADAHQMSWTAWAWYHGDCSFPALLNDFTTYTRTVQGDAIFNALASYPPPPPPAVDAGPDASTDASTDATISDAAPTSDGTTDTADATAITADGGTADATLGEASTPQDEASQDEASQDSDGSDATVP